MHQVLKAKQVQIKRGRVGYYHNMFEMLDLSMMMTVMIWVDIPKRALGLCIHMRVCEHYSSGAHLSARLFVFWDCEQVFSLEIGCCIRNKSDHNLKRNIVFLIMYWTD